LSTVPTQRARQPQPPSWETIWRITRPLLLVTLLMHVMFFAVLAVMAPIRGADVAILCTLMTALIGAACYCVAQHWRHRRTDMRAAKRWLTAGYFCIPAYQVLAIVVGGRLGLLTTHLVRLLGDTVVVGALLGLAIFLLPDRVWRGRGPSDENLDDTAN
jgi:energy-converting hydrogenase Eha subunit A